jgi:hypothetical protein
MSVKVGCSHVRVFRKCTWSCHDGKICSQIVHVLIANVSYIFDALSRRTVDVGTDLFWWVKVMGASHYVGVGEGENK